MDGWMVGWWGELFVFQCKCYNVLRIIFYLLLSLKLEKTLPQLV